MHCPKCDFDNPAAMRFCGQCGAPLALVCARCSAENPPGFKFCGACGAGLAVPVSATVPARPLSLEEQFSTLQQALPASLRDHLLTQPEGENRLVTVLFADMSNSVASTADLHPEEGADLVNRLLQAMVDGLVQYEGRVDRFLGDGVLAVFGTPQAHENDPERAIRAAWEIREAAQRLGLSVTAGINTGEVYVGEIGSEQHQERTVMGPVVNLAARLQGKAEPGQILVGEATYRQTQRSFGFTPLSLEIRGMTGPVRAYAVERLLPRPEKLRGIEGLRAELIGRDEELARLREALEEVMRGRGQMVSLIGEAGVGKSRLIAELRQALGAGPAPTPAPTPTPTPAPTPTPTPTLTLTRNEQEHEHEHEPTPDTLLRTPLWLEGRCLELGMTASYWLFVDLFREYFAFQPEDDDRRRGERIAASLRGLVERGDLSAERMEEIGPLFGHLLSVRFGTEWDERLRHATPEQLRHQTFTAVRDFLAALARQQPVLLVFEDLHWADTLSLDLISLLMDTLTRDPLLLLCAYRPEREHKCWHLASLAARKCPERYTEITLRELTPAQSRRLVDALLTIENLPAAVKELILEKARGNPFFVEEVLRSLIDAGMLYREGETWRAKEGIERLPVPETVQGVILSRVDRLEKDLKRVLESASVIGRLFRRRLLQHMDQEQTELERALWQLEERQLIYEERVLPEEEYSFQHVLTQETIYESILRRRRAAFHQRVAEAIEALYREGLEEFYEQLAYHYERTGSDEKAVEYLLKAGEKARRAYLNEAALGYFQRAAERLDSPQSKIQNPKSIIEWRFAAARGLALVYFDGMGEVSEAEAQFRRAIALGREIGLASHELVPLYFWLGHALWQGARRDEMVRAGEEGLALIGEAHESAEAALMNDLLACAHSGRGDREKARELWSRNAQFLRKLPYVDDLCGPYAWVARFYAWGERNLDQAFEWLQTLEQVAQQHHDLSGVALARSTYAGLLLDAGDLLGAQSAFQQSLELFVRTGSARIAMHECANLGEILRALGDLPAAAEYLRRAYETAEAMQNRLSMVQVGTRMGKVLLCQREWDKASHTFQSAFQLAREMDEGYYAAEAAYCMGRVAQIQGDRSRAVELFQEALALDPTRLMGRLGALEETSDDPEQFQEFCHRFREEHRELLPPTFVQWFLLPAEPSAFAETLLREPFAATSLAPEWIWQDPAGDSTCTVGHGLEVHAANGRDLWQINLSAPRLLRPASGDLAVQAVCVPLLDEKPAIGGLLLWKDPGNYLRLDRGTRGKHEISFQGCLANRDVIIGRGRLPSERVFLRLERRGRRVNALCSADGEEWFTVGYAEFGVEDPVEAGLHAIGSIDRTIYPGAYPQGTAIRFESCQLWALS